MRTLKKSLALVLAISMLLTTLGITVVSAATYNDITRHWAEEYINTWSDRGAIQGDGGSFRPDDAITRAEVAQVTQNVISYVDIAPNTFSDVDQSAWYAYAILKLVAAGALTGNSDGTMEPNDYMSREQTMTMLARAFGLSVENTQAGITQYSDYTDIADYATGYVGAMTAAGYVGGYFDGSIAPKAYISRAEFVKILDNMIKLYITEPGTYNAQYVEGITMIKVGGVTLNGIVSKNGMVISPEASGNIIISNSQVSGNIVNLSNNANVTSNTGNVISPGDNDNSDSGIIWNNNGGSSSNSSGGGGGGLIPSTYSVKFYNGTKLLSSKNVKRNTTITNLPDNPTSDEGEFKGWYTSAQLASEAANNEPFDFGTEKITNSRNFFAGFVAIGATATPSATIDPNAPTATPSATIDPNAPTATPTATIDPNAPTATPAPETATPDAATATPGAATATPDVATATPGAATATPGAVTATPGAVTPDPADAVVAVTNAGVTTQYLSLKEAVDYANTLTSATAEDTVVTILEDTSITDTVILLKSMTIKSAIDITVKLEMETGSAIQTGEANIDVVIGTSYKITFDGTGKIFDSRVIETSKNKANITVQNVIVQNFETKSTQGTFTSKGGGALIVDTVAFINVKATDLEKPYVIFDGTDLTLKGNVTFTYCSSTNVFVEKTKNVKIVGLNNAEGEKITIEHQDPSDSTKATSVVRFPDQAQADKSFDNLVLVNAGYKFEAATKTYEFNIVVDPEAPTPGPATATPTPPTETPAPATETPTATPITDATSTPEPLSTETPGPATPEPFTVVTVSNAGETTEYNSLKEAVDYANTLTAATAADTVVAILDDISITDTVILNKSMIINAVKDVTVKLEMETGSAIQTGETDIAVLIGDFANKITFDGTGKIFDSRVIETAKSKANITVQNVIVQNYETKSTQGTFTSKGGGELVLDTVAFINVKSADLAKPYVIFDGTSLTLKGNVTFTDCSSTNVFVEKKKNIKIIDLINAEEQKITIEHQDPSELGNATSVVRFPDQTQADQSFKNLVLVNDGYIFEASSKAYEFNIVVDPNAPTPPPATATPTADPNATATPTPAPTVDPDKAVVSVTAGGVVTNSDSLKDAVEYANTLNDTGDIIVTIIADEIAMTESIAFAKTMTITTTNDVTITVSGDSSFGFTATNAVGEVIITFDPASGSKFTVSGDGTSNKNAIFDAIKTTAGKTKFILKNMTIQNILTANRGTITSRDNGTIDVENIDFVDCKSTHAKDSCVIFVGHDLTLTGKVTFEECQTSNIKIDNKKNIKIHSLANEESEMISIMHGAPANLPTSVLRFDANEAGSIANFELLNDGYEWRQNVNEYDIVPITE